MSAIAWNAVRDGNGITVRHQWNAQLDIQGRMRDLELPPLSPYSIKYAGHGIEKGKLSMDVAYKILPDGQLIATNKLVLNQLAFGEPVEGASASLPVRLATALLADRNGIIDVDLPISGSLNDPNSVWERSS